MSESRVRQNYWANLVAALASFILAAGWYSYFLQPWLKGISRTLDELKATGVPEWVPYLVALAMAYLMAIAISCITQLSGAQSALWGARSGFMAWLGFVLTTMVVEYTYEVRWQLLAINAGYWLLSMVLMGAIVGAWKKKRA
jgi:hypothetical protein